MCRQLYDHQIYLDWDYNMIMKNYTMRKINSIMNRKNDSTDLC